jgi:peptidylprolyl isomerase
MTPKHPRLPIALVAILLVVSACSAGESDTAGPSSSAVSTTSPAPSDGDLSTDPASWVLDGLEPGSGETLSLADYAGKPLVVTFFGSDGLSDDDLAAKLTVAAETADQVAWVGIGVGDAGELTATVERTGIGNWPLAQDTTADGLLAAMNGTATPATAFYDQTGAFLGLQPSPIGEALLRSGLYQLYGIGDAPAASPSGYDQFLTQPTACGAPQPAPVESMTFAGPEDQALSGVIIAVISTSCGDIELALDADAYPETVNSFVFLARSGYYDGVVCHRLVSGFVLQCGDQTATGGSGPGYTVPDEYPPSDFVYGQGVVAMANAGPGTTGSQFFIVIGDASFLDPAFSILGTVVGSEDTIAALDSVPLGLSARGEQSVPLETVYIDGVEISG